MSTLSQSCRWVAADILLREDSRQTLSPLHRLPFTQFYPRLALNSDARAMLHSALTQEMCAASQYISSEKQGHREFLSGLQYNSKIVSADADSAVTTSGFRHPRVVGIMPFPGPLQRTFWSCRSIIWLASWLVPVEQRSRMAQNLDAADLALVSLPGGIRPAQSRQENSNSLASVGAPSLPRSGDASTAKNFFGVRPAAALSCWLAWA